MRAVHHVITLYYIFVYSHEIKYTEERKSSLIVFQSIDSYSHTHTHTHIHEMEMRSRETVSRVVYVCVNCV